MGTAAQGQEEREAAERYRSWERKGLTSLDMCSRKPIGG